MLAISQGVYYNKFHRVEICGCSSMVECQLPKLNTGVRFPSPAPKNDKFHMELVVFYFFTIPCSLFTWLDGM